MSDKKPYSENSDNKQERTKRRPWLCKQQCRDHHETKKDPEEIPTLRFGPNNIFSTFKEALANKTGWLNQAGEYYAPEPPGCE
jgi:hypothetical protein